MPELQAARGLNLHKLPAKAAFDAQVAVGYGVVERRSYLTIWPSCACTVKSQPTPQ